MQSFINKSKIQNMEETQNLHKNGLGAQPYSTKTPILVYLYQTKDIVYNGKR